MNEQQEKKNRRIGMIISVSTHGVLGLLFFFLVAWKAPFPPAEQYGIVLNFGLDDAGSGDVQPVSTQPQNVSSTEQNEPEKNEETSAEQTSTESEKQAVEEEKPVTPSQAEDSPVKTEETKQDNTISKPSEENKSSVSKPAEVKNQSQNTEKQQSTGAAGDENINTSQGDHTNAKGDQGNPEGKIDARALYGTPGGGQGGSSLDMAGWIWDFEPRPNDTSNQNGKIVFEIKINSRGELTSVRTLEKTVSPEVEKIYKEAVEELTFSPLSSNVRPAASSTGKITFIIHSR